MATIEEIRAKHKIQVAEQDVVDPEGTGLTLSEKARLAAQGALLNFSDEIAAAFRALGEETFEEAVADERSILEEARAKDGSLKYELGGAVLPALAAAPFTGGASIPVTMGRMAATGAAAGLTSAVGASEGNVVERVTDDPAGLALATGAGAVAGPAGQKVVAGGQKLVSAMAKPLRAGERMLSGKLAKPVEDEIMRIAQESNLKVDEIIDRVGKGEIIADMSDQATNAVRALYAKGAGGQIIPDAVSRRADELPADARATLQADLAPEMATGNVAKYFNQSIDEVKSAESAAYNKIFSEAADIKSNSLNLAVQEVLQNQKFIRNKVNTLLQAKGKPSLFKISKGDQVELVGDVDLETAEIVRRALTDKATSSFQKGTACNQK